MANSVDPDQLASGEANWSRPTLFEKAGFIRVQQDKGLVDISNCLEYQPVKEHLVDQLHAQQELSPDRIACLNSRLSINKKKNNKKT